MVGGGLAAQRCCEVLRAAGGGPLAVVGAGLIGLEVAATAARMGVDVTVIEAAPRPLAGILGPRAAAWLTALHRARGGVVRTATTVAAVRECRAGVRARRAGEPEASGAKRVRRVAALELSDGTRIACAHVLVGVGVQPATGWLAGREAASRGGAAARACPAGAILLHDADTGAEVDA